MCDAIAAAPGATADGVTLFGKNSDREPNEAQNLCFVPSAGHEPGSSVQCTYITIPQVARTNTVLLSKPFWMWGAEMGVNEHGLAIGNEAVFTKVPYEKGPALTGMDLLRLGLERASTAREAVEVITDLLARHGQGGNCGYTHKLYYHNSFLMADPNDVWVLETAGPHWAAKRIDGVYSISNKITIESDWDFASDELVDHAVQKGWCRSAEDFSFGRCYSDFLYSKFAFGEHRCSRTMARLQAQEGKLGIADFMAILRDHGDEASGSYRPGHGLVASQVCNHAAWGPVRVSQTTGSMVSRLTPGKATHFVTGTAAPCTSIFKPIWIDTPAALADQPAGKTYDEKSLFWRHEMLHRLVLPNYSTAIEVLVPARQNLETRLLEQALAAVEEEQPVREQISRQAFEAGDGYIAQCLEALQSRSMTRDSGFLYAQTWRKWNKAVAMPEL